MSKENNIHAGHRKRMKAEFLVQGLEGSPEHKALELLLFYAIPRGDVNPLAHALINRFGSLRGVLLATHDQLCSVKGIGDKTATLIQLVCAAAAIFFQDEKDSRKVYKHTSQFKELFELNFLEAHSEEAYLLCLDGQMKPLVCQKLEKENAGAPVFTIRTVMEAAVICGASVVVLAHNRVGGLAVSSQTDEAITRHLMNSLRPCHIQLYDHLIFAGKDLLSMREVGLIEQFEREARRISFPMIMR